VAEYERYLHLVLNDVPVALKLFEGWANPPGGVIPMPAQGQQPLTDTHLVALDSYLPQDRLFRFHNTWGESWGDRGVGYLPAEYLDKYGFECWVTYWPEKRIESRRTKAVGDRTENRWIVRDEWERQIYGFEVWDSASVDRRAWAFIIETDDALEIEDLYVRPEFRRKGYGRLLVAKVVELARAKGRPLRMWVPFADCRQENPSNYQALLSITHLLGLGFRDCFVNWAAYLATDEGPGEFEAIEPQIVPSRPKSALAAVLAAALWSTGKADLPQLSALNPSQPLAAGIADQLPVVNSPQWDEMNERRAELIRKDLSEGLTDTEREEYERLQNISLATAARAFPGFKPDFEELRRLREELRHSQPENE
jgi:GNAT superfamily N-acetyltransferase